MSDELKHELKRCPFCAKPGIEVEQRRGDFHEWSIECSCCCCRTDWYGSRDAAIAAWNARADTREAGVIGQTVESGEADSREKLEADVRKHYSYTTSTLMYTPSANKETDWLASMPMDTVLGLLDRQAAITERELCGRCSPYATAKDYLDTIDSLTAERDDWKSECSKLTDKMGEITNGASELMKKQPYTFDVHDVPGSLQTVGRYIDELTAERDELRSRLKTQADSFQKLERDNAQLRDKLERVREVAGGGER